MITSKLHSSSAFRKEARKVLGGKWLAVAFVTLLFEFTLLIIGEIDTYIPLASLLISPLLVFGYYTYALNISRAKEGKVDDLTAGLTHRFVSIIFAQIIILVKVLLWTLLLIIPGIIAALRYSQTFFIMIDDKEIGAFEAIEKSKELMKGKKLDLFILSLSFIGWIILTVLTFGIGLLWLTPYMTVTLAKFYDTLKKEDHATKDSK